MPDELISPADLRLAQGAAGGGRRRSRPRVAVVAGRGRWVGTAPLRPGEQELAVDATVRRAVIRGGRLLGFRVEVTDAMIKLRERPRPGLILFLVDASDSMGLDASMTAAKGAALALLTTAYQRRDRVAVITFRDERATVILPPTQSVERARRMLKRLMIGGATPLADGLWQALQTVRRERRKEREIEPFLALISDGGANVPLRREKRAKQDALELAAEIAREKISSLVIDTAPVLTRSTEMQRLAAALGGRYLHIDQLRAGDLVAAVVAASS